MVWDTVEAFQSYVALRYRDFEVVMAFMFIEESFDVEILHMTEHKMIDQTLLYP